MSDAAKGAARTATASPVFRVLARGGYAANGFVHVLIGIIVLVIAAGGRGESDQTGALKTIAAAPLGFVALWALAALLAALGCWHAAAGVVVSRRSGVRTWGLRISSWGQALVFLTLGALAASVALGARPDADDSAQDASRGVLAIPGGPWLLGLVGLGIGVGGVVFVVMGIRRSFRSKVDIPSGALGALVTVLGVVGFIAKGLALAGVGILLLVATVTFDPDAAGGLDGALQALLRGFLGPLLVGSIGAGFVAYGIFCFFRARYARL